MSFDFYASGGGGGYDNDTVDDTGLSLEYLLFPSFCWFNGDVDDAEGAIYVG